MPKARIHNEWFQPIKKTSCPCGCKKTEVFAWGNYVNAGEVANRRSLLRRLLYHACAFAIAGSCAPLRMRLCSQCPQWVLPSRLVERCRASLQSEGGLI